MPLYEYVCEADGSVLELIRPMSEADKPVPDPEGKGRCFVRKLSTFAAKGEGGSVPLGIRSGGGGCACGKPHGGCGSH
ncbi:MAG: FmdB family zinc ribbon protein [Phycisphaerales bacterium]|nr:zinc ribbon domain-containing protein [Planctomycetota bacterium]